MANPPGVTDVVAIYELCKKLVAFIEDVKCAPVQYENLVHTLNRMHLAFTCIHDEIRACSNADSSAVLGGNTNVSYRLSSEIALAKTALENVEGILRRRYAEGANSRGVIAWKRRLRWGSTHSKVENCLRSVRHHLNWINLLIGTSQIKQLNESVAAINLCLNDRSAPMGLPGSGGVPSEHIRFRHGLGMEETFLLMNPFSNRQRLKEYLKIMFDDLPGKRHIANEHYRLYCDSNSHEPQELTRHSWPHLVKSGCTIFLAFVVGTWQMSCINFCPGCARENRGDWKSWQNCRCGCLYFVSETGEVAYEPQDGFWSGEAKLITGWNDSKSSERQKQVFGPDRAETVIEPGAEQPSGLVEQEGDATEVERHSEDELYFRCMIMVYDPIFNFVCRNVFCRCVLGKTSFTSTAPQIDIPSILPCPNHAKLELRLKGDYVLRQPLEMCIDDPYFERFGGYESFRQIARYLYQHTIAVGLVDMGKLCPDQTQDDASVVDLINAHASAVLEYRREVLSELHSYWQMHLKACFEKSYPEFVIPVETWLSNEQNDLAEEARSIEPSYDRNQGLDSHLQREQELVVCLSKGRVTVERPEDIKADRQFVLA